MRGLFLKPVYPKNFWLILCVSFLQGLLNLFASDALASELSVWGKETAREKMEKEKSEGMKDSL